MDPAAARAAVKKIGCEKKQQRPPMGGPHISGLIYIRNTAHGMNMIIGRGQKTKRAEERKKQPENKSLSERELF